MAPADRDAWARETVHIYGGTRDGARESVRTFTDKDNVEKNDRAE
jgi:hypothetical protein